MPEPEPVPVRDLEVANRIARAVRGGRRGARPADRTPTIEQLVAAFGEPEPTIDARRRAARALALAGVAVVPDVLEAAPGQRVTLEVHQAPRRRPLVAGIVALVLLFAAVAAAATQLDFSDDEKASSLPAGTTATTPTNTVTQEPTSTTSTATTSTGTPSTGAGTTAKPPDTAAERRRKKRIRERRAAAKAAKARRAKARAAAKSRVTVRLNASLATFLCVEGDGKQLFNGTLSGARTFRGRVVRLNIGLGPSTRLTANGKAVPLTASPTGIELTPKSQKFLPLGQRPCA